MSSERNNQEFLAAHGLTPLEDDALLGPGYAYFTSLNDLALYTVGELALARSFNPELHIVTADAYREAIRSLIEKGWLKVVTEKPEMRATQLAAGGILIPKVDDLAKAGSIDFTAQGYRWFRRLLKAQGFGSPETLVWADEEAYTLNCIAGTKRACQVWLKDTLDPLDVGVSSWFYDPVCLVRIHEPERVGAWKPREAAPTYPRGWRVTISVKRLRRRRLSLPDWEAEGWIVPRDRLEIRGRIQGIRFWFSDGVHSLSWDRKTAFYQACLTICDGEPGTSEKVFTTLDGVQTLACTLGGYGGTHFKWRDAEDAERTKQLTIPEAVACLQEGFAAWKQVKPLCYNAATRQKETNEDT